MGLWYFMWYMGLWYVKHKYFTVCVYRGRISGISRILREALLR